MYNPNLLIIFRPKKRSIDETLALRLITLKSENVVSATN